MNNEELKRRNNESNKEYFTRAAAYIKKLKDAGQNEQVKAAMGIVMESLAPIIMQHVDCEIAANDLDENTGIDYSIRVFDVINKDFYKYNCADFMKDENKGKQFEIKSFIKKRTQYCIGDAIAHNLGITHAEGKLLNKIRKVRRDLARKYEISEDAVNVELIYEGLNAEVSEEEIIKLLLCEKGYASVEEIEENGGTVGYTDGIDVNQFHTEIDDITKGKMDEYFAGITKMEMLILMQDAKLLDDELSSMEVKEFARTKVFKELFSVDTSIRSRKDPKKTIENKRAKMREYVIGLRDVIKAEDINSEGLLTRYCHEFLSRR